jgi:AcrR family transcriptional regulator
MARDPVATRMRILDAASTVLLRDGSHALTLEAAAAEAGVSKGGLLYHFPSKAALLDGLVERWIAGGDAEMAARADGSPGSWVRAYLEVSDLEGVSDARRATDARLLAALAAEPERLDSVRRHYDEWQARAQDDGVDPVAATVARLAIDGLWIAQLLRLAPPEGDLHDQVVARIRSLVDPGA